MMRARRLFSLLAALSMCLLAGCGGDPPAEPTGETEVREGYTRLDVGAKTGVTEGFGTQFDTCIVELQNNITDAEWQIQVDRLEEMNLQCVRIRFFPEYYERGNDNGDPAVFDYDSENVDFDSNEMKHLYRLLDVFEKNGVKADLSWYGCRTTFDSEDGKVDGSWLGGNFEEVRTWVAPPRQTDAAGNPFPGNAEFAESVSACLNYLLDVKKYTCVNEFSIFPEPDHVFDPDRNKNIEAYRKISADVLGRLEADGIRDRIQFSGPADYSNDTEVYEKYLKALDGLYDKNTSSVYKFKAESTNAEMAEFAKGYSELCKKYGTTWGVAETGTCNALTAVSNSDTETFERALFLGRQMINFVNNGCTNIKYFVFGDCYYDGNLNELGLFKFRHENFVCRPMYYSWSLVCKYTDIGSEIRPIVSEDPSVCATAFRLPSGKWSYYAANNGNAPKKIAIVNSEKPGAMKVYRVTGSSIPEDRTVTEIPVFETADASGGICHLILPANSFVVATSQER